MLSEKQIEFTKENIDMYLKEAAKEYRKQAGKDMPAGINSDRRSIRACELWLQKYDNGYIET